MVLVRCLVSVIATLQKRPGCDCFRAAALYIEAGHPVGPHLPAISRIPRYIGHINGILAVGFGLAAVLGTSRFSAAIPLRTEGLLLLCFASMLFSATQRTHWICESYFQVLRIILVRRMTELEGLGEMTDVEPDRPPVDVSPYRNQIAEDARQRIPECPICTDAFTEGETIARLPCEHIFHEGCLATWLRQVPSCPFCRQHVHVLPLASESPPNWAVH